MRYEINSCYIEVMKDLVLIIDMQNAYNEDMPWACSDLACTKKNILRLLDSGNDCVFTAFIAPQSPAGRWIEYNNVNTAINEDEHANAFMDEFIPYIDNHKVFYKSVYSSFGNGELRQLAKQYDRIILTGVVAECCVLSTAFSCIDEGLEFIYLRDAVSGISNETAMEAEKILSYLTPVHGRIKTTDDYLYL